MENQEILYIEKLIEVVTGYEEKTIIKVQVGENIGLGYHRPFDLTGKRRGLIITHIQSGKTVMPLAEGVDFDDVRHVLANAAQAKYCILELAQLTDWNQLEIKTDANFHARVRGIFSEAKGL